MTSPVSRWTSLIRRSPELTAAVRRDGIRPTARRVAGKLATSFVTPSAGPRLLDEDIVDVRTLSLVEPTEWLDPTRPLRIAWVCSPPAGGSGGHTTAFRMVEALEAAGHTCFLYLYDVSRGDIRRHEAVIRRHWPNVRAEVRDALGDWDHLDAFVATGWESAHVIARRSRFATRRFYFVQDYEPFFYPRGWEYVLAQDTYRMGFTTVAIGRMVKTLLADEFGVESALAEFGCDTEVYSLTNSAGRDAVAMYARPGVARRAVELGLRALEQFHGLYPEVQIHLYGDTDALRPTFPCARHGSMSPPSLSALYNTCFAGIALSFTNISLIAEELLACGTIPVVNDDNLARMDLDNPNVAWSAPTPSAIAATLSRLYTDPNARSVIERASASVRQDGWTPAARVTVAAIERGVYGGDRSRPHSG